MILGATGGIGKEMVRRSMERGHQVTALAQSPEKISQKHALLTVVAGDLLDRVTLARNIAGHDAVLSAFGPPTLRRTTMRRDFTAGLASALKSSGVRRVLVVSAAFLFRDGFLPVLLGGTIFRNVVRDTEAMEKEIMLDGLDWTVVRPPRLTDGSDLKCRIEDGRSPKGGFIVSRAAVAQFMVEEVAANRHVRQIVGIAR
jgi:putative NADH-flavin reductase